MKRIVQIHKEITYLNSKNIPLNYKGLGFLGESKGKIIEGVVIKKNSQNNFASIECKDGIVHAIIYQTLVYVGEA